MRDTSTSTADVSAVSLLAGQGFVRRAHRRRRRREFNLRRPCVTSQAASLKGKVQLDGIYTATIGVSTCHIVGGELLLLQLLGSVSFGKEF